MEQQLQEIRAQYAKMEPEQLKVIDPCMGSGHILCYLFDVLMQIYLDNGYSKRETVRSILENNLFGLDIDKRAAQIAYFSVMMKAREYDSSFLNRKNEDGTPNILQPRVYEIQESQPVTGPKKEKEEEAEKKEREEQEKAFRQIFVDGETDHWTMFCYLQNLFADAKEYGSILQPTALDYAGFLTAWKTVIEQKAQEKGLMMWYLAADRFIPAIVELASVLCQKYDAVVTNPPYMGASNMNPRLNEFIKQNYADYKSDFFSAFIVRAAQMTKLEGRCGFFTPYVWMFIQSYEKLRQYLYSQATLETLFQFEYSAFEEATVPVCTFTFAKRHVNKKGNYLRLVDFRGGMEVQRQKTLEAIANHNCGFYYEQSTDNFAKIPGSPVAYWLSSQVFSMYKDCNTMEGIAHPKVGMQTSNNEKYLRMWFEINYSEFCGSSFGLKWIKYLKGGAYRKWYGNLEYLLRYNNDPQFILNQKNARVLDLSFLKKRKCTWTDLTSGGNSFRYAPEDTFYDISGHCFFPEEKNQYWLLAYANTNVFSMLLKVFNSTFHCQVGDVAKIVVPNLNENTKVKISDISMENVKKSQIDWDSFETSWDFKKHPLV